MIRSKKFNQVIENYEMMQAWKGERYANAWKDIETELYHFGAGYDGSPEDYKEEWATPEELLESMRKFADLRHWNYRPW